MLRTGGLTIRTTIDLRYQAAADQAVQDAVNPTDPAIGGLAMVEPGTGDGQGAGAVPADGPRQGARPDLPQLRRPAGVRRLQRLPARLDVQGVRARAGPRPGRAARLLAHGPGAGVHPRERVRTGRTAPTRAPTVWEPANSTAQGGTYDLYTGTQKSVNTFFANLEQITGLCKPYQLAKDMGIVLTNPAAERVPSFTLGVSDVSPLEMAEAYATFAARGEHCESRPVTAIEDLRGNLLKEYPERCPQVLEQRRSPTPSTTSSRASSNPAASGRTSPSTRRTPARPAPPRTARRCGSSATRRTSPPPR